MRIGIGNTVPERSNLPGQSGGGGVVIPLIISYSASAFCANASDPTPTVTGNVGAGTYSSTAGLVFVSTSTGEVDISASTPSATAYVITYTDTNSATATFNLTINALDNAAFSYSDSAYRQDAADPTPTITGLAGGTFSGSTGLVINSTTGEIDLDASTIAAHTITYDTTSSGSSVCPNTSTQTVYVVNALAQVNNVYSMEFDSLSSQYIDLGDSDNLSFGNGSTDSPFSISAWINMTSTSGFRILSKWDSSLPNYEYTWGTGGGNKLQLIIYDGTNQASGYRSIVMDTILNTGQWYHTIVTYDGRGGNDAEDGVKIYVDGALVSVTNTVVGTYTAMNDLSLNAYIGALGTASYANGLIDEVAIFNVELTAQEVQNIYLATETGKTADLSQLTTPPVAWYRMGD